MAGFPGWERLLLQRIGAPATPDRVRALDAWQRAEGGGAAFNPLNTTLAVPGASAYNRVGVRNYASPQQGIDATLRTLQGKYRNYPEILAWLRNGGSPAELGQLVAGSPWGTGSGVLRVLGAKPGPAALPAAAPPVAGAADGGGGLADVGLLQLLSNNMQTIGVPALSPLILALASTSSAPPSAGGAPRTATLPTAAGTISGGKGGLAELLHEGLGGPTHSTGEHIHAAFTNPREILNAIALAQRYGLAVRENPYVGDTVDPVHATNSYHYRTFPGLYNGRKLGEAIDASGPQAAMNAFYAALARRYGRA